MLKKNKDLPRWDQDAYTVNLGMMGDNRADVYHVYYSGRYMAQRTSLEGCQDWINDHIEDLKDK